MKIRRIGAVVALAASGALALSACTTSSGGSGGDNATTTQAATTGGTVTVAEVNQFTTFNPNTSNGNTDINSKISLMTSSGFYYIDDKLTVQPDKSFGTYEKLSDDPLKVKYTLADTATWSDGTPVGLADLLLGWAVESGYYNNAKAKAPLFDYAGDTTGLGMTDFPEISDDNKSITLTYSKPFADWEVSYNVLNTPAQVVAKEAGLADTDALVDLFKNTKKGDPDSDKSLAKVASFWNTGFDSTTLPSDKDLYLSSGPYVVSAVEENKSVTLVPNTEYKGDHKPKLDSIVVRTIADPSAQIQALKNGEVDVISPQASADTLESLNAVQGAKVYQGDQLSYDHVDLNFSGVFEDPKVREAFMKIIPRKAILDAIITPLKSDAKVLDSQIFVPSQPGYADSAANNGSSAYADVDVAGAKELLGGKTPTVRILYNSENPNRVDAFTLISKSATEAGFKIVDEGDPKWGTRLGDGSYDASIFGWINSGVGVSGVPQIFKTGGGGNYNGFSNPTVDKLSDTLVQTIDPNEQVKIEQEIDKNIWSSYYGLPLFQSVGVVAVSDRVNGISSFNPNQNGVFWNTWEWTVNS